MDAGASKPHTPICVNHCFFKKRMKMREVADFPRWAF